MKTAVITGCRRGLGLTLLKTFVQSGYNVIACIRKEDADFESLCTQLEEQCGVFIRPLAFDIANRSQIEEAMQKIESMDLEIDVLINCAGINVIKPQMFVDCEEVEESFKINYFAPFLITKSISGLMMRAGKGNVINITSVGSLGRQPGGTCYDASKAALNQYTQSIAQELAPFNIRVNAIASGPMKTDMFTSMKEDVQKKLTKTVALKRVAEPEEIAKTALFLASDDASFITGQILRVDGGSII